MRVDSNSYEANYALAMHHQQLKQDDKAMAIYRKLNILYPKIAEPFYNMGALYLSRDSLTKALEFFTMATEIDQVYAEAWFARGLVLEQQRKDDQAYRAYNQAATLRPGFKEAEEAADRLRPTK